MNISSVFLPYSNISFCHNMTSTSSSASSIGSLNHQTSMFRELRTDEFVRNEIVSKTSYLPEVNLVSGACSTGEEIMSYLVALDEVWDKINFSAFDIDSDSLNQAKSGRVFIIPDENEKMLLSKRPKNNQYKATIYDKFHKYFKPTGKTRLPVEDTYLKCLKMLNPFRYKKEINTLTSREYQLEDELVRKIHYFKGDVSDIHNLFEPDSIDVLLFRNAMYHLLCMQDEYDERVERSDSDEIAHDIAFKMAQVVKIGGLVVFGERENKQGYKVKVLTNAMKDAGFEPVLPLCNDRGTFKYSNIWQRTK